MNYSTIFTKPVLKTKKQNKIKLLFLVLGKVIKNNPLLFFFCSLLAIITAVVNFNIGVNIKHALFSKEKTLSEHVIKEIENEEGEKNEEIEKKKIREILEKKATENNEQQKKVKEKIKDKIKEDGSLAKKDAKK
ncbi:hypothetical protein [endosymbiont GvMRE of Glomus versiforme]|uniref:hypothetical protein n=1 Tax=endosymbiont GvMRE of Glomus versiforme TaxID=2039283 RepID=UPI000EC4D1F3|nr:hypothetical protein [endosymbiont GvMRE of Glomus versiforme]RHZ35190.1 ABC transporter ATP-binding protein [endosymbiont GvMRE of Glomus versiforme]